MRTLTLLFALAGAAAAGCGDRVIERTIYVDRYPDAGVQERQPDPEAAPEHGFSEGEGQGGGGGGGPLDERIRDAGRESDVSSVPDTAGDAGDAADDHTLPFLDFVVRQEFYRIGSDRVLFAHAQDAESPVDVKFDLTNALGEHEFVLVPHEQASFRGDLGQYEARLPGVWNQPGVYRVDVTVFDRAGNQVSDSGGIPVYDPKVTAMPGAIGNPVFTLTYDEWKRDVVGNAAFRDVFNRQGRVRDKTTADEILDYEATLGERVVDDRAYTKLPAFVHLRQYVDEHGAVELVYEYGNPENYFVGLQRPIFEAIGVVTTEQQAREILGSR